MQLLNESELDFSPHSPFRVGVHPLNIYGSAQPIRHIPIKQPYILYKTYNNNKKKVFVGCFCFFFFFLQKCMRLRLKTFHQLMHFKTSSFYPKVNSCLLFRTEIKLKVLHFITIFTKVKNIVAAHMYLHRRVRSRPLIS